MTVSDAIECVYREDAARLWRALLAYTGQREIATDALAETFVQALARGTAIRSPRDWIWRAAFRIARGMLKRPHTGTVQDEFTAEPPESVRDLVRALAVLPERQRLCVVLHDYADRPVNEVAASLGIAAPTVYVQLSRGRRRLRELLEERDG